MRKNFVKMFLKLEIFARAINQKREVKCIEIGKKPNYSCSQMV
jgi:hypothetical protein